jgi:hypothetical protein
MGHEGWSRDPDATANYGLVVTFEILGQEIPIYEALQTAVIELQELEVEAQVDITEEAEVEFEECDQQAILSFGCCKQEDIGTRELCGQEGRDWLERIAHPHDMLEWKSLEVSLDFYFFLGFGPGSLRFSSCSWSLSAVLLEMAFEH